MVSYDEYKKIVISIMNEIYKAEKQRNDKAKKLIAELEAFGKGGKLGKTFRVYEILHELSMIYSIDERYNYNKDLSL